MITMVILTVAAGVLASAAVLTVIRMAKGPSSLDRAVAADLVIAIVIASLGIEAVINDHSVTLVIMLALAVVGFAGSLGVARFVTDRGTATKWDSASDQDAQSPGEPK